MNRIGMETIAKLLGYALVESTERHTYFPTNPYWVRTAFVKLGGRVSQVEKTPLRLNSASRWLDLSPEQRAATGVITPTQTLCDEINEAVRARLTAEGRRGPWNGAAERKLISQGRTSNTPAWRIAFLSHLSLEGRPIPVPSSCALSGTPGSPRSAFPARHRQSVLTQVPTAGAQAGHAATDPAMTAVPFWGSGSNSIISTARR